MRPLYGVDVRNRLLQGAALDAGTYLRARDVRRELHRRCVAVLAGVDAVVTPTVPIVAPRLEDAVDPAVGARLVTFTRLADLTGLPAISLPVPGVRAPGRPPARGRRRRRAAASGVGRGPPAGRLSGWLPPAPTVRASGARVGTDAGGTFTDVVGADGRAAKVLSTPADPARAVVEACRAVGADRPGVLTHGTTVATNALLEGRGAPVGAA